MIKKRKPYKVHTKEFKLEALRLMEASGRSANEISVFYVSTLQHGHASVNILNDACPLIDMSHSDVWSEAGT